MILTASTILQNLRPLLENSQNEEILRTSLLENKNSTVKAERTKSDEKIDQSEDRKTFVVDDGEDESILAQMACGSMETSNNNISLVGDPRQDLSLVDSTANQKNCDTETESLSSTEESSSKQKGFSLAVVDVVNISFWLHFLKCPFFSSRHLLYLLCPIVSVFYFHVNVV